MSLYLSPETSPVPLPAHPLIDGDGSLGDPASFGPAVWMLVQFAQIKDVKEQLDLRCPAEYAWAVGRQMSYLKAGKTDDNGLILTHI